MRTVRIWRRRMARKGFPLPPPAPCAHSPRSISPAPAGQAEKSNVPHRGGQASARPVSSPSPDWGNWKHGQRPRAPAPASPPGWSAPSGDRSGLAAGTPHSPQPCALPLAGGEMSPWGWEAAAHPSSQSLARISARPRARHRRRSALPFPVSQLQTCV